MKLRPLFILSLLGATTALSAANQPNIIFILADDLGWGDVGAFYQNARRDLHDPSKPAHSTPNLDRMAAEGARLTNHYVGAPVCVSSRSSLLQGVTQGHTPVRDNEFDKALEPNHTLATVLHTAGYSTAVIGKWGLQGEGNGPDWPSHPLHRGFDYYYGYIRHVDGHEHYPKEGVYFAEKAKDRGPIHVWENMTDATAPLDKCYTTDLWTARAKKYIAEQASSKGQKPFFLYLAYDTPHAVLELPTQPYPAGQGLHGGMQWLGTPGHAITTASGTVDSWIHPDYADATYAPDKSAPTVSKPWPNVYKRYATDVRRIDDGIGDILQLLRDLKIDNNTLVVFASDNGPSIESYLPDDITPEFFASFGPFDGIKRDCWEGGMRTPGIVHWPARVPAGRVIDRPSATWDWMNTFAEVAGQPALARSDGISLLPELTGQGTSHPRDYLYFEYFMRGKTPDFKIFEPGHRGRQRSQMQAIREGDLLAVRYDIKKATDKFEIYNVATDPKEVHNLASQLGEEKQKQFQAQALQSRRPDAEAPRPYDKDLMPASTKVPSQPGQPGLAWGTYNGAYSWVPDFRQLTSQRHGNIATVTTEPLHSGQETGLYLQGYINIPTDGEYTFALKADGAAELRLHDATIIDADFGYTSGSKKTGAVRLQAGLHPIRLSFRTVADAKPSLELQWSGPGIDSASIPASALSHELN